MTIDVYIAGFDVFYPHADRHFEYIAQQLAKHNLRARPPVDGGLSKGAPLNHATAEAIAKGNRALIRECPAMLANLNPFRGPDPDSGTSYEVGYGQALGKSIVVYSDTPETYAERVRRLFGSHVDADTGLELDNYQNLLIENFQLPWNLMMTFGTNRVTSGLEDAIEKLAEVVKRNIPEHA
jgi:nucleoside 2-deoxyribosyltransferase